MKSTRIPYKKKPPVFTGPRARFAQMLVRLRQLEGNPHHLALGMGVGIFVSTLPIIPFQVLTAFGLAIIVRGSKSAAFLGTWLSNPLTIPLVYYANYKLGCVLLGYRATLNSIAFESFSELMALGIEVFLSMMVGGAIIGAVLGVVTYFLTLRGFIILRRQSLRTKNAKEPGAES